MKKTIWNKSYTCIFVANIAMVCASNMVNPLMSTYAGWLGAGTALVGMLTGMYFAVAVLIRPVSGPMLSRIDNKLLMILTYALGVVTNIVYALCPTIGLFLVARVLQGVQTAFQGALLMILASDSLESDQIGAGLGMFSLGTALASAIGPSICLAVRSWGEKLFGNEGGGYCVCFLCAAVATAIAIPFCCIYESKPRPPKKVSGGVFGEIIAAEAVIPSLLVGLLSMANTLYGSFLVPYSVETGFAGISLFFTWKAAAMLVARPVVDRLVQKFGAGKVILYGLVIYAASFAMVSMAGSIWVVYLAAIPAAAGYAASYPQIQALCMQLTPLEKRGAASNTTYLFMDIGFFLGPTLAGFVLSAYEAGGHPYATMYMYGLVPVFSAMLVVYFWYVKKQSKKVADPTV